MRAPRRLVDVRARMRYGCDPMAGPEPWWEGGRARRIATGVVLAASALMIAWPLASAEWLPFVDYPQHLGTIAAIHGQGDPAFAPYFVVEYSRSQYLLLYVIADWLAYPLGVEGAARLTAILSIAGLPLALGLWLREHGREPMLGALAAGIALHVYVFWGFLNFSTGMTAGILALAAFTRLSRQPTSRNAALFGLGALATFYSHAQLYAWLALACLVTLLAMAPAVGRARAVGALWRGLAGALPSVLGLGYWLHRSRVLEHGEAGLRSGHAEQVMEDPARFAPVEDTVRGWLGHSFEIYRDGAGIWIAVAFFACALLVIALRSAEGGASEDEPRPEARTRSGEEAARDEAAEPAGAGALRARARAWLRGTRAPAVRSFAPELVAATTFALYLFAPVSYRLIEPISHRFLPLALALLCALGPRARVGPRVRYALGAAMIALSIFVGVAHSERFRVTDEEMGELAQALEHTEPGRRLMGLIYDQGSEVLPFATYLHAHQYYQARVGGMACFGFVEFPKSPVQWAEGAAPPPFPPRFEWTPQRYDHRTWGAHFDYWLIRHPPGRPPQNPLRVPPGAPDAPRMLFESSRWTLYGRE